MTLVWAGLGVGSLYGLMALAFNIVLSNSGVFNFALPQFVMLGGFIGYQMLGGAHVPFVLVLVSCAAVGGCIGLLEDLVAIRPLGANGGHAALVTTVGVSQIIQGAAMVMWGTTPHNVSTPGSNSVLNLFGGRINALSLILIMVCVALAGVLHWTSRRTRFGLYGRVSTLDAEAARLRGVNVVRVRVISMVAAGAVGCLFGPLVAALVTANADLGNTMVVFGFVALALGGFGSYPGSALGGFAIGIIQVFVTRYWGSQSALPILYALLLAILLIKPSGLLGDKRLRMV